MEQTAVEWFAKELKKRYKRNNTHLTISEWAADMIDKLAVQAKEMEKEQLEKCYEHGNLALLETGHGDTFEQYYNKTYKKAK